jgi:hypothetical protein
MLCMLHMFCMKFYEFLIAQCSWSERII